MEESTNTELADRYVRTQIVKATHTAEYFGSGMLPVFATPALVALMEATAQEGIQPRLSEGFITLGIEISVKHLKATPVGMMVTCEVTLVERDDRLFVFEIKAWDESGLIGEAVHKRFMVNGESFMKKLKKE